MWLSRRNIAPSIHKEGYVFEVNTDAVLWRDWARERGASPEWIARKARDWQFTRRCEETGGEYITVSPIERDRWLSIRDLQNDRLISVDATAV